MEKSIEILIRCRPVVVQVHVVERWNVFRVRTATARSRGPERNAVAGPRRGQSGVMHRVVIVPVRLRGRLLLSAGQPGAVQADGRTVRGLVVRAAIVRGRPTRWVRGLVPRTVGLAARGKRAASGLVVRTGDAGAPVGVRMDGERRAGHVEAGSIRTRFSQEVPGVELQTACHQVGSGLGQAFTQHLHVGDHIWPFPVA